MGVVEWVHDIIQSRKIKTAYREFTDDVFYVAEQGLGLSEKYGLRDCFLSGEYISKMEFIFSNSDDISPNKCTITHPNGGKISFKLSETKKVDKETFVYFLSILNHLSEQYSFPIFIKSYLERIEIKKIALEHNFGFQISE